MSAPVNDGGPAFAAWRSWATTWEWGRVEKRTAKMMVVATWSKYGGGEFRHPSRIAIPTEAVFFDNEADARALVKAIKDLNDRENDTRRQYAEKRKALVEAARAKGGAA